MALLTAHFDVGHQFSRQDLTWPHGSTRGTVQTVNRICIGQRNCGDAIVGGVTLARAAQQIRPVRPDISDHMKVRTAAQILGVGAGSGMS
jgi:hypothetical protein